MREPYKDVKTSKTSNTREGYEKRSKKAAAITISCLGDNPLKAAQKELRDKHCTKYASKPRANKLSIKAELLGKTKHKKDSMTDHIAELETLITKLVSR